MKFHLCWLLFQSKIVPNVPHIPTIHLQGQQGHISLLVDGQPSDVHDDSFSCPLQLSILEILWFKMLLFFWKDHRHMASSLDVILDHPSYLEPIPLDYVLTSIGQMCIHWHIWKDQTWGRKIWTWVQGLGVSSGPNFHIWQDSSSKQSNDSTEVILLITLLLWLNYLKYLIQIGLAFYFILFQI